MAFTRPTLTELVTRIQEDLVSRLELKTPILRRSVVYVVARVLAGAAHMLHGHLEFLSRQVFPDMSDEEYLIRQAALFGLTRNQASYAQLSVGLEGTNGSVTPAGTVLVRADGARYTTDAEATIAGGVATVAVTASEAGEDSNCDAGDQLTFESPVSGVSSIAEVASSTVDAVDEESIEDFRTRLIERMQSPPHGGNAADYVAWAKEVAGVTRAWCYPLEGGPGTVTVRFVRDDDDDLIPSAGEVSAVQTHINGLKPVTATVTVAAPTADPMAVTVHIVPDNASTRAAVEAELADLLRREAEPAGTGVSGTILLSHVRNAIGDAEGVTDYALTTPAADITPATGHIVTTPATVTFT